MEIYKKILYCQCIRNANQRTNRARKLRWFSIRAVQSNKMIFHLFFSLPDAEILNNDLSNEDYSYLFESLIIEKSSVRNKLLGHITKKINCLQYPSLDDFNTINEMEKCKEKNYVKHMFEQKFYLF